MKKIIYILLVVSLAIEGHSQTKKIEKGDKKYADLAYVDAIATYEKVANKGYKSVDLFQKLGNSYFFNAKLKEANKWYTELFALNEKVDPEYYYRYSITLKAVENYAKANEYLDKFHQMAAADIRGNQYSNEKNYLDIIAKNSGRYEIKATGINSRMSDYGTSFYGDKILFSTSRDTIGFAKVKTKWTNHSFTNLYVASRNEEGELSHPEKFSKTINSKFNEDTPVFTKDLKTVYFTRNNFNKRKTGTDENSVILLKLYKATLADGKWIDIKELPFNSDNYSVAHPALSPDEKTLYFASNMPGTKGQSDLFKVAILENDTYGVPQNLTGTINTEARETFPFITKDNELYFATDGHQGLGGLDIFVTKLDENGMPGQILNIGAPVNGNLDDFAFIIDNTTKKGYFSSNRENGKGFDDIYFFEEKKPLSFEIKQELEGQITDMETKEILSNAPVTLFDANFNETGKAVSDKDGGYHFDVTGGKKYYVRAEKENYNTKEAPVEIPNVTGKTNLPIALEKKIKEVTVGSDLAKTFDIKIIYFDLDKAVIRKDAAVDLAKIVEVMKENPTMKIDVRSHTDSRQTNEYNQKLSDKRAKATIDWMVKNGISSDRITGKGYGESQLINRCADGVDCSEEEHQLNRRSEFIITAM
ncbi:OmpA family protein [Flavobacterium humi]|uniref:Flagellar motor protein MotB n=1 Tax=Flavobacterium humi TaxID=2562683 RepID=A0A4Z0L400_9FLAO|nr:OmpA family protein [Flavobacterium humi]TGD56975.1 flagellar motor protein MotB [Flavobacterium humi]